MRRPYATSHGLHPAFMLSAADIRSPHSVGGTRSVEHRHSSDHCRSTPGALAPVRVILSRSIFAYSAPSAPLAGTSRLHRRAAYTRCLRCACPPRRPASGSVLSPPVPSWHAALYDPGESVGCLRPVPSPTTLAFAHSARTRHSRLSHLHPLPVGPTFRGYQFAVATTCRVACLPWRTRPACTGRPRRLRPGFRRVGHPSRRRISLRWQPGKFHRRVFHPLELQLASLQAESRVASGDSAPCRYTWARQYHGRPHQYKSRTPPLMARLSVHGNICRGCEPPKAQEQKPRSAGRGPGRICQGRQATRQVVAEANQCSPETLHPT